MPVRRPSPPKAPLAGVEAHYPQPGDASRERVAESTLTSKGQVTIPHLIRTRLQLEAGDSLVWQLAADGRLFVEPKRSHTLAEIRVAIAAAGAPRPARAFSLEEMDEAIGQAVEANFGRR